MPGTSKAVNPKGIEITFTEENHSYVSIVEGVSMSYVSGTQFLHDYLPQFDPDGKITERKAKELGITPFELRKRWNEKGRAATTFGTRVHETIEDIILGRDRRNTPNSEKEIVAFENAVKIANKLKNDTDVQGVEKIVFDHELGIAGTIDLLTRSKKDGSYIIVDHKTNEKIEQENRFNKFCSDPISHLSGTDYTKYALQLNLYGYLLKYGNYIPKNAKISFVLNHVNESGINLIPLPNYQNEIKDLMIDFLVKKSKKPQILF